MSCSMGGRVLYNAFPVSCVVIHIDLPLLDALTDRLDSKRVMSVPGSKMVVSTSRLHGIQSLFHSWKPSKEERRRLAREIPNSERKPANVDVRRPMHGGCQRRAT